MKINKLSPDIYEIEDFVTIEQQKEILKFASELEEEKWWLDDNKENFFYGKQYNGVKPEVFTEIDNQVQNLFDSLLYVGYVALQRYRQGASIQEHRDYWQEQEQRDQSWQQVQSDQGWKQEQRDQWREKEKKDKW